MDTIRIEKVEEHEDGSATVTFDMDDKTSMAMARLGVRFALYCAAYNLDIEDAFSLIEGKRDE
jgi:hypothetical protein